MPPLSERSTLLPGGEPSRAGNAVRHLPGRFDLRSASMLSAVLAIEAARGMYTPTLVPYMHSLGGDKHAVALAAAVPSMARTVCAFVVGPLCDRVALRAVLIACLLLAIIGNVLHLLSLAPATLVVSRAFLGASFAEIVPARTYAALSTSADRRVAAFADVSAAQLLGIQLSPLLAAPLAPIRLSLGAWRFSALNLGGALLAACCAASIAFVLRHFDEPRGACPTGAPTDAPDARAPAASKSRGVWPRRYALGALALMDFSSRLLFSALELSMAIIADERYGWGVAPTALLLGCCGGVAILLLLSGALERAATAARAAGGEVALVVGAFALMLVGCLLQLCSSSAAVFILSCALWFAVGYPIAHTLVASLFSTLVDQQRQGLAQGCLAVAASAGRIVGYMWAPLALDAGGARHVDGTWLFFLMLGGVAALCIVLSAVCYRAMAELARASELCQLSA